ncbi:hypothetical protein FA13DRAFT_1737863 [Coprinellus micaceus]|uniref:Uncharacterized protein n=1 Tax=Coprinellus micaceus TaxID=71717 RepID=A0A4Y7SVR0_COPMI|nr:hypothetical protein FA13DRAFT_1737863 [Coprinellus micaceus]
MSLSRRFGVRLLWKHDFSPDNFPESLDFFICVRADLEATLSPFAASDFHVSVDVTEDRLMDFVEKRWSTPHPSPRLVGARVMTKRKHYRGACRCGLCIHPLRRKLCIRLQLQGTPYAKRRGQRQRRGELWAKQHSKGIEAKDGMAMTQCVTTVTTCTYFPWLGELVNARCG